MVPRTAPRMTFVCCAECRAAAKGSDEDVEDDKADSDD